MDLRPIFRRLYAEEQRVRAARADRPVVQCLAAEIEYTPSGQPLRIMRTVVCSLADADELRDLWWWICGPDPNDQEALAHFERAEGAR